MLTRPGSPAGPNWMRRMSEGMTSPAARAYPRHVAWIIPLILVLSFGLGRAVQSATVSPSHESQTRIAGMPLVACGIAPRGIIAIGGRPTGVVALGGIAVGIVAVGGLALGGFALSGVTLGIFAIGGGAVGYKAFGGLAVGSYVYAGNGVAFGYHEASGRQREKLVG